MAILYNLARVRTATRGTGPMTLGAAVAGFRTFANAGVQNGNVVAYSIRDGTSSELGYGTYTSSTQTLTRTAVSSTATANAKIDLSGNAEVLLSPNAGHFPILSAKSFGAVGDGTTNDTAAWAALAAAAFNGCTIVAQGDFSVTGNAITFNGLNNITLDLRGAVFRQQTALSAALRFTNCGRVDVLGGIFYGYANKQILASQTPNELTVGSGSYNGVAALFFDTCDDIEVRRVHCYNHAGGAIAGSDVLRAHIHHNYISGIGPTYLVQGDNGCDFAVQFANGPLERTGVDYLFELHSHDNRMLNHCFGIGTQLTKSLNSHNDIIGPLPGQHAYYIVDCNGLSITGNHLFRCGQIGVKHSINNLPGIQFGTAWATGTVYAVGAEVRSSSILYECLIAHTSGVLATDVSAGKWRISTKYRPAAGVIANNFIDRCLYGIQQTTNPDSVGRDIWTTALSITDNVFRNISEDAMKIERGLDTEISGNSIADVTRYGIHVLDFNGRIRGNTLLRNIGCALVGSLAYDTDIEDNVILDSGQTAAAASDKFPIRFHDVTADGIPLAASVTPKINFLRNDVRFSTGDAASPQLATFDARYSLYIAETKTNSALTFRVNGTLLRQFRNEFAGYFNTAQNLLVGELAITYLHLLDNDASHDLILKSDENNTADRTLNLRLGNATRTLTISGDSEISGSHTGTSSGTNTGDETAAGILAKLVTVDGSGSGLDADLLDGLSSAAFQPVDADLTSIAALTTAAYGRALLETASEAALKALINLEANTDFYAPGGTDVAVVDGGTGDSGTAWAATTPTVTARGVAGTFAATCNMYTKTIGKTVFIRLRVTVTDAGTATGFSVPLPVAHNSTNSRGCYLPGVSAASDVQHILAGLGDSANGYNLTAAGAEAVAVTSYYYEGVYESA